ncbi:hypothetical protein LSAT2_014609 [Lamellibrachia satsuma]|nr:hypothetical protein LSAT2_014609 [Lamellibrachia satsuma]
MAQCMITSFKDEQHDRAQDGEMSDAKVTTVPNIPGAKKAECCKDFLSTLEAAIQSTNSPSLVPSGKLELSDDNQQWNNKSDNVVISQGNGKDKVTEADLESFAAYERLCNSHLETDKASLTNYFKPQHPCHVCKGLYPTWSHLRRHLQTHTSYRPYKCHSCEKSFRNYSKLKRHLLTHTGVKPYKCPVCSKAVSRQEHLKRHLLVHSEQRPYKCSICDYSARRIDSVKTHQRNKHKEDEAMQILFMGSVLDESREQELNRNDTETMSRNASASDGRPKRSHKRKKAKPTADDPASAELLQESTVELELKKREQIASEMLGMMAGHSSVPVTNCVTESKGAQMTPSGQFSHDQHQVVLAAASALCQAKLGGDIGRDALPSDLCKSESSGKQLQETDSDNKNELAHLQLFPQPTQLLAPQRMLPNAGLPNKTTASDVSFHNQQTSASLSTATTEQQCALLESAVNMKSNNPQHNHQVSAQNASVNSPMHQMSTAVNDTLRQQSVRADVNPVHLDQSFPLALLNRQKQPQLVPNTYNAPLLHDPNGMKLKTKLWEAGSQLQQPAPQLSSQQQQNTNVVAAAYSGGYVGFPPFFGQTMSPQDAFIANRYFVPPENTSMVAAAAAFEMQNSAFYMSRQHPGSVNQTANTATSVLDTMPESVPQIPEFFRKRIRQGCEQLNKLSHSPTPTMSQENTDTDF